VRDRSAVLRGVVVQIISAPNSHWRWKLSWRGGEEFSSLTYATRSAAEYAVLCELFSWNFWKTKHEGATHADLRIHGGRRPLHPRRPASKRTKPKPPLVPASADAAGQGRPKTTGS
jgi:hypothetical protein